MATQIKCPSCGNQFEPNDAIREEVERELRSKAADWQKKKNEEFQLKLEEEKKRMQSSLEENIRKSLSADYENQLKMLQQNNKENEEKLKQARQREMEFLEKMQELKTKEEELELNIKRRLNEEREKLSSEIRDLEKQKLEQIENEYRLRLAEKEKQLEDQKKLAEEAVRKAQQGSMQLQGEVQELMLEEILRQTFPYDKVTPVGKGVRGADCIHTICNPFGQECGKIIYESKRTKDFSAEWIDKLKADMRSLGADIAVIVTQALPKDMERFGEKDGVYICTFAEVRSLSAVLRTSVLKVFAITQSQQGKGDKMSLLYDYLTGNEFSEQWQAIREGFMGMKVSIQKERDAMEKLWKAREKQLEKVLLNAAHIRGSIEGIAGSEVNLNLLDGSEEIYLEQ